jgi:alpha-beta hydrolase superfamily lysophospholipase
MGSLVGLEFALRFQDQLAGMVVTAAAVTGDETRSPAMIALARVMSKIAPKTPVVPALRAALLSHDAAVVADYDSDPLNYRGPWRPRIGWLLLDAGRRIRARAAELQLPIIFMHGGEDAIVPVSGSEFMYQHVSSSDKTLKVYPGLFHEIHNELEKNVVLTDALNWLDQH